MSPTPHDGAPPEPDRTIAGQEATLKRLLTLRQRKVCALYWFDNLTQEEIGQRFAMTRGSVSDMIGRARKRLIEAGITPPKREIGRAHV